MTANGKSEATDYTLHGKLVTHMTVGSDKLHFFYDAQSRPTKVNFNGVTYTYLHNLQGDVVGILDNGGNLVVKYKYDAWGKPLSTTGSLADTLGVRNPFRYRGYVFDEESGLYYLRSRYYNSEVKRFMNEDALIGKIASLGKHNQYAYCANVPVALRDDDGKDFRSWLGDLWEGIKRDWERRDGVDYWSGVCAGLSVLGYEHSRNFLGYSLLDKPSPRYYSDKSDIADKIRNDSDFKATMKNIITNRMFDTVQGIVFETDFDLFGSLHKANIVVSPVLIYDGIGDMYHVTITDTYDFKYEVEQYPEAANLVKRAMKAAAIFGNNMAYCDYQCGVINTYDVTIDFYVVQ